MIKIFILIIFLLSGCAPNQVKKSNNPTKIIFSDDLSLEEFKIKLEQYTIDSTYPNIDN